MTGILLSEHRDYKGKSKVFTGDTSYVGDDFNDKASSIRIIKVIESFENNRDNDYVCVEYNRKNGLDGKVSYIEVVAP